MTKPIFNRVNRLFLISTAVFGLLATSATLSFARPKLVVALVIDQFRADYLTRFENRFLPPKTSGGVGGFRYLMHRGAYYPFAEYGLLQNMTGPGHATILSGSYAYQFGIPVNAWFDSATQKSVYCVSDPSVTAVSNSPKASTEGKSPRNFSGSTVGDEMKNSGHASRVITISLKDRAAILLGGKRADLALWFDDHAFEWVTSTYYLPERKLPDWVLDLNQTLAQKKNTEFSWAAAPGTSTLSSEDAHALKNDRNTGKLGITFPHVARIGSKESLLLPYGLQITVDAGLKAASSLKLGQGKHPDLLALSFSSHDYMGHRFGLNSREMEEMTLAEDRELSRFLTGLEKILPGGLKDVAIVLTADHGVAPNPDWIKAQEPNRQFPAGRIDESKLRAKMNQALNDKFGTPKSGEWVFAGKEFNYYFNMELRNKAPSEREKFESLAKQAIQNEEGVAWTFSRTDYDKRTLPPAQHETQILHTYVPGKSGDVMIIPKPYYIHEDGDTSGHLTGYTYDRQVPLLISGPGVKKSVVQSVHAGVIDIAPTLAFLMGTVAPALSEGRVLSESLE